MSVVLVTGASGFVGRRVVPLLVEAGHEVHAASSRTAPEALEAHTWHQADLLDPVACEQLIDEAKPTHLLHLAWYTEHGRFWQATENVAWVEASLRLWRAFAAAGGRRFVGVGSCAEYDWSEPVLSEATTPLRPATTYGASKDAVRQVLESASADKMSFAWARLFFLYGPEEHSDRLVASVGRALIEGRAAKTSDGRQVRDFLFVDDAARALALLMESELEGAVNVGSGEGIMVREVVESVGRIAGAPELIEYGAVPRAPDDPASVVADVTRLKEELGWEPAVGLDAGIERTVAELVAGPSGKEC